MKKIISLFLAVLVSLSFISTGVVKADKIENIVISLGDDLSSNQKQDMINRFEADPESRVITVTNKEERKYLGDYVSEDLIGTRAISCSYVEELDDGSGIVVETSNVTWVTPEMVKNALVTAGVKDAKVKVSAPFKVSGTAALTGVIKAFEIATGVKVSEKEKKVANEEIAKTGELGQEIGKDSATELIRGVKEVVVENKIKDPEVIRETVEEKARELNINLNEEQFNKIVELMKNIGSLNLDLNSIKNQLGGISEKVGNISNKVTDAVNNSEEAKGFLAKIEQLIRELIDKLFG
ncbi:MAG: DUF1002 domain-containing protein [Andreesenia angusta]|nr:DUF1002 domain-containing protein [Andreesenia angusta]